MKENPTVQTSSEIDLLEVFNNIIKSIKQFFTRLIRTFIFLFVFAFKIKLTLALALGIGIGASFILYLKMPRIYTANFVIKSNGHSNPMLVDYINSLNQYSNKQNVSDNLQISDSIIITSVLAERFVDISDDNLGWIKDQYHSYNPLDTTLNIIDEQVIVSVSSTSNYLPSQVKEGLHAYILRHGLFTTLNEIRVKNLHALIMAINIEIQKLDSLQNVDYFRETIDGTMKGQNGQIVFYADKNKQLYHQDKLKLLNQKLEYEKELDLYENSILIYTDSKNTTHIKNPLKAYLIKITLSMLIIAYVVSFIYRFRVRIKEYIDKKVWIED